MSTLRSVFERLFPELMSTRRLRDRAKGRRASLGYEDAVEDAVPWIPYEPPTKPTLAVTTPTSGGDVYVVISWIVAILTFLGAWAYCTITYGFLFGFGLCWLPSAILAVISGFLWPLLLPTLVGYYFFFVK